MRIATPEVRPRRRLDQRKKLPQDTVLRQIFHAFECRLDGTGALRCAGNGTGTTFGIEAKLEQLDQLSRNIAVSGKCRFDESLRQCKANLSEELGVGAKDDNFFRRQACGHDQTIEIIVLHRAREDLAKSRFEHVMQRIDLEFAFAC